MEDENYLNIPNSLRSKQVYRIIPLDYLYTLFADSENVLVRPRRWDDPFENFVLRTPMKLLTGEIAHFDFHEQLYAQCWTLRRASDAMWRIYSPDRRAVRIRSTIHKLAQSLCNALGDFAQIEAFIGKVQYLPKEQLITFARTWLPDVSYLNSRKSAETLLVKNRVFMHEKEIRLICFKHHTTESDSDLYRYTVDPHTFLDQIMLDPRIPAAETTILKKEIRKRTGYRGRLVKSRLYGLPPRLIIQAPMGSD